VTFFATHVYADQILNPDIQGMTDRAFSFYNAHPGFTSHDMRFEGPDLAFGPALAASPILDMNDQSYFMDERTGNPQDPYVASIGVFSSQNEFGGRGWIVNNLQPTSIQITVKQSEDSFQLYNIKSPKHTVGDYIWSLKMNTGSDFLKKAIQTEVETEIGRKLQPTEKVIIYGFTAKAKDTRLYSKPGADKSGRLACAPNSPNVIDPVNDYTIEFGWEAVNDEYRLTDAYLTKDSGDHKSDETFLTFDLLKDKIVFKRNGKNGKITLKAKDAAGNSLELKIKRDSKGSMTGKITLKLNGNQVAHKLPAVCS